ncbi:MAG: hypothetical protein GY821_01715 [Gammaproteobacteria bacterium]|nr:hypothetical protein [Gammaproteobacteria bacterium]
MRINKKLSMVASLTCLTAASVFVTTPALANHTNAAKPVVCPAYFQVDADNPLKFKFYNSNMQPYSEPQFWAVGDGHFSPNELYKFTGAKGNKGNLAYEQQGCHYQLVNGQKTAGVMSMPAANLLPNTSTGSWEETNGAYTCDSSNVGECPFTQTQ